MSCRIAAVLVPCTHLDLLGSDAARIIDLEGRCAGRRDA